MTDHDRELTERYSTAISNIANECVAGGVGADVIVQAIAVAMRKVIDGHADPEQGAAALRIEAAKLEAMVPTIPRSGTDVEMLELSRKAHEFINAMQVAGLPERLVVSVLTNTCIERVARTNGAAGASGWLAQLSAMVLANAAEIEATAKAH